MLINDKDANTMTGIESCCGFSMAVRGGCRGVLDWNVYSAKLTNNEQY